MEKDGIVSDSTLDITQPLDDPRKLLKIVDNGDGTYGISVSSGLSMPVHDYIALSYTGDNLTSVVFKDGGAGGTTAATLTLAYTGSRLDTVTKI